MIVGDGETLRALLSMVAGSATLERFVDERGCVLVGLDGFGFDRDTEELVQMLRSRIARVTIPVDKHALVFVGVRDAHAMRAMGVRLGNETLVGFVTGTTIVSNVSNDVVNLLLGDDVQVWLARVIDDVVGPAL